jgi:hypothetical protein
VITPPSLPLFISSPLLAAALWVVFAALGFRALRWMKISLAPFSSWERGALCCAIGAGLLQYEPYLLGAFGALNPRNVLIGVGLTALLLVFDIRRISRSAARRVSSLKLKALSLPHQLWLLLFAAVMLVLLPGALTLGGFGSDDDGYHLTAPLRWLTDGTLSYLPTYTNTNASAGFEMLYAIGLATGNAGIKIIHFAAGVFSLWTLWLCARRMSGGQAGALAISLLMVANPLCNVPFLFGMAFVDFGPCWMIFASVLVWLVWRAQPQDTANRLLILMALLAGFAASFKSTALTVALAWTPILIWEARQRNLSWIRIAILSMALGFIALLPVGPWLFRSWRLTGNPVFPMLSSLIPTRDWNQQMAAVFGVYVHYYSWAVETPLSLNARRLIVVITGAVTLLGSVGIVARSKDPVARSLIGFAGIMAVATLAVLGMYFRYWLPAEMCVALVLSVALVRRFSAASAIRWAPCVLLLAALVLTVRSEVRAPVIQLGGKFRVASNLSTPDQEYAAYPPWSMWHYIDAHIPADAHVLVGAFYTSFGASNYGCFWLKVRCFTTDSYIQTYIDLNDWQSFLHSIDQAGIHYLLVSDKRYSPNRIGFSFTAGDNEYPFSRRLADEFGTKLAQFGPLQFYSLGSLSAAP